MDAGGTTTLGGAVGSGSALDSLTITGASALNGGAVTTGGAQSYGGAATLGAATTLSGSSVGFGSTVDGAQALTVNAATTTFTGDVGTGTALASLTTDTAGTTSLGGDVRTSGAQRYRDAVVLTGDAVLTSSTTIGLEGTVNGARALTLNGTGGVTLDGVIGGSLATRLTSLTVSGPLDLGSSAVSTTGRQQYGGAVELSGAATTLTAASLGFGGTVDSAAGNAAALTVQSAGTTTFGGSVGAGRELASLRTEDGGAVQLQGASVDTTGEQRYSGAVQLSGSATFTGSLLDFAGALTGAQDLTLVTNTLTGATSLDGTGRLTIRPLAQATSIGLAGGAGALQISQAVLDGAAGFAEHTIGRSDGTGDITAGALTLRRDTTVRTNTGDITVGALTLQGNTTLQTSTGDITAGALTLQGNTTLQTNTGDIELTGAVNGGFDLNLNSGGLTRIGGAIGAGTALRSLTTDNNAGATDWNGTIGERTEFVAGGGRVVTTGGQTYADPVVSTVALTLTGGAIVASQTANDFGGLVNATADTLTLNSGQAIRLGNVTIANASGGQSRIDTGGVLEIAANGTLAVEGGRLEVQSAGVLRINGDVVLNGGTLVLLTTAPGGDGVAFTDPDLVGRTVGLREAREAAATITQGTGSAITSAPGTLLVLRSPNGGSLLLDQTGNALGGEISAVTGTPAAVNAGRDAADGALVVDIIRINSSEIRVAGGEPRVGDRLGVEADVIKLSADQLGTAADGLIRARLSFDAFFGASNEIPALTLVMSQAALSAGGGFGTDDPNSWIRVSVGDANGGFVTVRPREASSDKATILLSGDPTVQPFYDGAGKVTEIRVFYNGDTARTAQESGALSAVQAVTEDARQARFEEAVRTENVRSRLRSGVIAEVGSGRPATVGRESIQLPDTCEPKSKSLECAAKAAVLDVQRTRFQETVRTENVDPRVRSGVIAEVGPGRPATVGTESVKPPPECDPVDKTLECRKPSDPR